MESIPSLCVEIQQTLAAIYRELARLEAEDASLCRMWRTLAAGAARHGGPPRQAGPALAAAFPPGRLEELAARAQGVLAAVRAARVETTDALRACLRLEQDLGAAPCGGEEPSPSTSSEVAFARGVQARVRRLRRRLEAHLPPGRGPVREGRPVPG
ncbi:MAG: hypothetical protein Kow0092_24800 [Deferrisomatales bacterium]